MFLSHLSTLEYVLFGISCAALVEWFLFAVLVIGTFFNVMVNHDQHTSISLCFVVMVIYVILRSLFLPFILIGLFGSSDNLYGSFASFISWLPHLTRVAAIILATWWNVILIMPCITVWYSRSRYGIGNKPLGEKLKTDEEMLINTTGVGKTTFRYIVILPVYNETFQLLKEGILSILQSNYPPENIEIHISFDSHERSEVYESILTHFGIYNARDYESVSTNYNGSTLFVHKFKHGGKRLTQHKTFTRIKERFLKFSSSINNLTTVQSLRGSGQLVDDYYSQLHPDEMGSEQLDPEQTIILLTDSDNYLYDNAIRNLTYNFNRNPKKLAFAGYMTCMSSGKNRFNFWKLIQDTEYVGGEMNSSFELMLGTINCLPGGFTAIRGQAMLKIADIYFSDLPSESITDYHRNYLGEDRFMTHIMHQNFPPYSIGFCPSTRCKTDPPASMFQYVKQRRRWLLGAIGNETYMLTDRSIWKQYKLLLLFKLFQLSWKGTTFGQIVITIIAAQSWSSSKSNGIVWTNVEPFVISIAIPLGINWIVTSITAVNLGRYKLWFH
ncbi:chitin synthase-domain-containing protein [Blyttiomyces helicus]|uniref:chitin synthase n=1 Tax=Blyttiomyces helicus TaxID=388810 RepID=A0A4P9WS03_9FUNG|nr:chitin synthase-domain-containing protein [Blyttiomyces helicus]|eukprot:RKO94708.1 chitin synthase-domain-containing protein [Blyttiomyces helicus]